MQSVGMNGSYSMTFPDGRKVQLTTGGRVNVGEVFWHGSSWNGFVGVLKDRKLKAGPADPIAVYALKNFFDVTHAGYFGGVAFWFEAMCVDASKACGKKLWTPVPGICTSGFERACNEWRFHEDSITLKGARINLPLVRTKMQEAFGDIEEKRRLVGPPAKAKTSSSSSSGAAGVGPPAKTESSSSSSQPGLTSKAAPAPKKAAPKEHAKAAASQCFGGVAAPPPFPPPPHNALQRVVRPRRTPP